MDSLPNVMLDSPLLMHWLRRDGEIVSSLFDGVKMTWSDKWVRELDGTVSGYRGAEPHRLDVVSRYEGDANGLPNESWGGWRFHGSFENSRPNLSIGQYYSVGNAGCFELSGMDTDGNAVLKAHPFDDVFKNISLVCKFDDLEMPEQNYPRGVNVAVDVYVSKRYPIRYVIKTGSPDGDVGQFNDPDFRPLSKGWCKMNPGDGVQVFENLSLREIHKTTIRPGGPNPLVAGNP